MSTSNATPAKPAHESEIWTNQHHDDKSGMQHAPDSLEKTAEEASALFSTTINSLAHDVRALGHLTTWKDLLEGYPATEDVDPTQDDDQREAFLESLCDLDDVVSSVEKKVGVLRQIVSEEQRALENLNLLHKDSVAQNENLAYLVERCLQIKSHGDGHHSTTMGSQSYSEERDELEEENHANSTLARNYNQQHSHNVKHDTSGNSKFPGAKNNVSKGSSFPGPGMSISSSSSRHSMDSHAHAEGLMVHLDRVTQEEFESVPRTTRGRVQVTVINEALDHLEKAFHKMAIKERKKQVLLDESKQAALWNYNNRSPEKIHSDDELIMNLIVSEEELRRLCPFFIAGELQARTVLTVLKTLRRIKQVPATKGRVLYKLCL